MKLFDNLSSVNQKRIKRKGSEELVSLLKSKHTIHSIKIIDMLMIYILCCPGIEFNFMEFKLLFESTQNEIKIQTSK